MLGPHFSLQPELSYLLPLAPQGPELHLVLGQRRWFSLKTEVSLRQRAGEESKASLPSCPLGLSLLGTRASMVAPPQLLPRGATEEKGHGA